MKKNKNLILILFFMAITIMFFTYKVVITFDSSHYLWLTSLLTNEGDFATWDVARGIVFPMIIRVFNILFGQNSNGVLIGMFIFYLIMLLGIYLIYKDTIKDEKCISQKMKWILGILCVLLIVINPMIIGYYHTLLTEFVGITFAVIGCYLAWKWIGINFWENKVAYIIYTSVLAVLTAIAWQLKQPYVTTILFPIVIAAIISFIRQTNLKNFLQRLITLIVCLVVLVSGIKIWNIVLEKGNVQINQDRTSAGFFATSILSGLTEYDVLPITQFNTVEKIQANDKISQNDKQIMSEILQEKSQYKSYVVVDTKKDEYKIIYTKDKVISTGEAVKFWLTAFGSKPFVTIGSYIDNYLATISVYGIDFTPSIVIDKKIHLANTAEIGTIGFKIYGYGNECVFWLSPQYEMFATEYREVNRPVVLINWIMRKLEIPSAFIMKISYLLLPILSILSIVAVFITKKGYTGRYNKIIDIIAILFIFSFLHILMHAFLGAIIDRYTMPALATTFLAILLSIYAIVYRKNYKIKQLEKGEKQK